MINNSNVQNINSSVTAYTNYLGRPWSNYARVVFQNTYLGNNINAAGWSVWSKTTANTDHVTFAEYVPHSYFSDLLHETYPPSPLAPFLPPYPLELSTMFSIPFPYSTGNTLTPYRYANTGPGSVASEGPRATFSSQLNASIPITTVLGSAYLDEWWVDSSYL